ERSGSSRNLRLWQSCAWRPLRLRRQRSRPRAIPGVCPMARPRLVIKPWPTRTRLLMTDYDNEVLRAALPSAPAHPRAAPTLSEGLALWLGRPLSVVVCAADPDASSALGLCDGFGFGSETVHYEVDRRSGPASARSGALS